MPTGLSRKTLSGWILRNKIEKEREEKKSMFATVAVRTSPFAGFAPAVFRFVMLAWNRMCGGLPAVVSTGSVPIVGH